MTYYTIAYKDDGTCCSDCQPDPSTCSCVEGCCDCNTNYAGKWLTMTYEWRNNYGKQITRFCGVYTYTCAFSGTRTVTNYVANDVPNFDCFSMTYDFDNCTEDSALITMNCAANDPPVYWIPSIWGSEAAALASYNNSLLPNCGYAIGCVSGGGQSMTRTCTSTYVSSCFSLSYYAEQCEHSYFNESCDPSDLYDVIWSVTDLNISISATACAAPTC